MGRSANDRVLTQAKITQAGELGITDREIMQWLHMGERLFYQNKSGERGFNMEQLGQMDDLIALRQGVAQPVPLPQQIPINWDLQILVPTPESCVFDLRVLK